MFSIMDHIRPRYIGISIVDGQLTAMETKEGIFIDEDISGVLPEPIWQKPSALKAQIVRVYKAAGVRFWTYMPVVVFGLPCNAAKPDNKTIYNAVQDAGAKRAYLLDEFLLAALGTGVYKKNEGPVYHKKIYVWVRKEVTYLGVILAGGTFELRTIPKGYDSLTAEELQKEVKQLLENFPIEIPAHFHHQSIKKEMAEELEKAWRRKPEKQVYLTAPKRFKGKWGDQIDDNYLVYTEEGEQAVIKGIEQFIPTIVKDPPFWSKALSLKKIFIPLILLIAVVLIYNMVTK